ncbi:MAG: PmoA family protein [Gemmataceae bacterium]
MRHSALALTLLFATPLVAQTKAFPALQAVPEPYDQVALTRDGKAAARLHFGAGLRRPFVYPILGPSGAGLTRMGHPHDPVGHSHHNSVWISHNDVNGVSFWADRGKNAGRIVTQRLEKLEDGAEAAATLLNHWIGPDDKVLLVERRRTALHPLDKGESLLLLDLTLEAKGGPVTLGKTPFGLVGVRMAKTIGIADGGGAIRNSEGQVNEKGEKGCFWKPARWVDYSGPSGPKTVEGITLFDHPANPNHPSVFHVREDGWMGTSLTFAAARELIPGAPLRLRYGLYVHAGAPPLDAINGVWQAFAKAPLAELTPKKK